MALVGLLAFALVQSEKGVTLDLKRKREKGLFILPEKKQRKGEKCNFLLLVYEGKIQKLTKDC